MLPVFPDTLVGIEAEEGTPVLLKYSKEPDNPSIYYYENLFNIHDPHQAKLRYNAPFHHNTRDYSPNNYTAVSSSGVTISRHGLFSNDATHHYTLNSAAFPSGSGDFTIEFWMYLLTPSVTYPFLISSSLYTASGYYLTCSGTGTSWSSPTGTNFNFNFGTVIGGANVAGKASFRSDRWHHVAVVRRGIKLFLYLDGILVSHHTDTAVRTVVSSSSPKIWGVANATNSADRGYISDVKFYDSAKYTGTYIPNFKSRPNLERPYTSTDSAVKYTRINIIKNKSLENNSPIQVNSNHFLYSKLHSVFAIPKMEYKNKILYKNNIKSNIYGVSGTEHTFTPGLGYMLNGTTASTIAFFPNETTLTSEFTQIVLHKPEEATVTRAIACSTAYTGDITKIILASYGTTIRGLNLDCGTNNTAIWMHYPSVYIPILRITATINDWSWYVLKTKNNTVYLRIYSKNGSLIGSASTSTCTGNAYASPYMLGNGYRFGKGYTNSIFSFNTLLSDQEERSFILDPYSILK